MFRVLVKKIISGCFGFLMFGCLKKKNNFWYVLGNLDVWLF